MFRLHMQQYCLAWIMPLRLTSLKVVRLLFFSNLVTKKLLSMVDVPGKIDAKPPTNLSRNGYMLRSLVQASSKESPLSKLSMDPFTLGSWWYKSHSALCLPSMASIYTAL